MTRYQLEFFLYAQKSFMHIAEALTPLLRLGTFSWIVTHVVFKMIPLKLKVDTKHRLLMPNTCNVDEYFQNTPTPISSQAPLCPRTTDLK